MEPFQTQAQLRALRIHAVLDRFYNWLTRPFVRFFDPNTQAMLDRAKVVQLKVVK